jgi:hypothetical protein
MFQVMTEGLEVILARGLIIVFYAVALLPPFFPKLREMRGLRWLPVPALAFSVLLIPAYGFRWVWLPLIGFGLVENLLLALFYHKRSSLLSVLLLLLLTAATLLSFLAKWDILGS